MDSPSEALLTLWKHQKQTKDKTGQPTKLNPSTLTQKFTKTNNNNNNKKKRENYNRSRSMKIVRKQQQEGTLLEDNNAFGIK